MPPNVRRSQFRDFQIRFLNAILAEIRRARCDGRANDIRGVRLADGNQPNIIPVSAGAFRRMIDARSDPGKSIANFVGMNGHTFISQVKSNYSRRCGQESGRRGR
jgi:hypothetical protein